MAKRTPGPEDGKRAGDSDEAPLSRLHVWQIQAVRDLLIVAAVVGVFWMGYALRAVTVPLLVALLLAYLFEPLIARMCRHPRIHRPLAVGGLLATVGVVLVLVLALVTPILIGQTTRFVGDVRGGALHERVARLEQYVPETYREDFRRFVDVLPSGPAPSAGPAAEPNAPEAAGTKKADAAPTASPLPADTDERLRVLIDEHLDRRLAEQSAAGDGEPEAEGWLNITRGGLQTIFSVLGSIVQLGLVAFLIPFYFFFFSVWYPDVVQFGRDLIPQRHKGRTLELLGKMDGVVAGFVRGRIVISLIMGALLAIGWMICGVPYAISLGFVVGIFCAVPYLGTIGVPIAVALLFFDRLGDPNNGNLWWLWAIVWPTVVFAVVQTIEGYALTPMIAGKATNLDPVTILVAVLAGGSVLGVYGMLLAIPLAACAKILVNDVVLPDIRAWTRGERADPLPIDRD